VQVQVQEQVQEQVQVQVQQDHLHVLLAVNLVKARM
jgi:hypothetical protein